MRSLSAHARIEVVTADQRLRRVVHTRKGKTINPSKFWRCGCSARARARSPASPAPSPGLRSPRMPRMATIAQRSDLDHAATRGTCRASYPDHAVSTMAPQAVPAAPQGPQERLPQRAQGTGRRVRPVSLAAGCVHRAHACAVYAARPESAVTSWARGLGSGPTRQPRDVSLRRVAASPNAESSSGRTQNHAL